jgi:hypothetical protein
MDAVMVQFWRYRDKRRHISKCLYSALLYPAIRSVSLRHTVRASVSDIWRSLSQTPRNREARNGDSKTYSFCFFFTRRDKVRSDLCTRLNFGFTVTQNWGEAKGIVLFICSHAYILFLGLGEALQFYEGWGQNIAQWPVDMHYTWLALVFVHGLNFLSFW